MHERRGEPRLAAEGVRARVRLGPRLVVLDVTSRGALVEGAHPLRPGSRIDVHLETDARRDMVAARVTRCGVVAIDPETGVTYRAALSFNESCEWVREVATHSGYGLPVASDPGQGAGGELLPGAVKTERK
jgi:hypothetical protein